MFGLQLLYMRENMNIVRLEKINSTNSYAKSNLSELQDKTVIVAQRQTAGRGRFDRVWVDLGGDNIFATIVLKPSNVYSAVFPNITQLLAVVLAETIENYGVLTEIKWPNDVLISGKKIAGILSETVTQGSSFKGLVLGFGVNLNSDTDKLKNIKDKEATSLNLELGVKNVDKEDFLNKLLNTFFEKYDKFLNEGFVMIMGDYLNRASFLKKQISVRVFNETKSGIAKKISDDGELVIESDNKELVLTMGDIL